MIELAQSLETQTTPRRPRTKIGHFESRVQRDAAKLAHTVGATFFTPAEIASLPEDQFRGLVAYLSEVLKSAVEGHRNPPARPTIDAVMANWTDEMESKPAYFHWSASEREIIRQKLIELGAGAELLLPGFAYSVAIKEPSGRVRFWNRRGEITKV